MKLSAAILNSLPEGTHNDHITPGLSLRVGKKRRTWYLRYVGPGGKQETDRLGHYIPNAPAESQSMGLAAARERAKEILGRVEAGVPVSPTPVQHPKQSGETLEQLVDGYERYRQKKGENIKSLPLAMRTIRAGLKDHLPLPARSFTKADLISVRDRIAERAPHQSSAFLRYLGPVFRWAEMEDRIERNFVPAVLKIAPVTKRERILTHAEIRRIWEAAGNMEGVRRNAAKNFGRMIRFLLLTAQRRDEAASLKHGHIIDGRWKQTVNKSDRLHVIKLSAMALAEVGTGEAGEYVFAGVHGKMSGFSRLKADLDAASGVKDWVIHDLRRTATSELQELGIDHMVVEAILNHSIPGVAGVYMRAGLEQAKAEALEKWAARLEKIIKIKATVGNNR